MSHDSVQHFVSPSYGHEKLASPSYGDLVDIFEDRTRNWLLLPAERLLGMQHCQIAAVALLTGYFEGIEIYFTGEDSRNKSTEFFSRGFARVFAISADPELSKKISGTVYNQVRCGFAHDGMFRNRVLFSDMRPEPILVTWPKKNGVFDVSGQVGSILINPQRFYDSIRIHFDRYIENLRKDSNPSLRKAFEAAVALKWGLEECDPIIGMTEDEFRKT